MGAGRKDEAVERLYGRDAERPKKETKTSDHGQLRNVSCMRNEKAFPLSVNSETRVHDARSWAG
jgi:hypothetical protein